MEQGCIYMWILVQSFPYPTFPISAKVSRVLKFWFYQLLLQFLFAYCYIPHLSNWLLFFSGHWYRNKIICDLFLCSSRNHLRNYWKKCIIFGASAVGCNLWKGKVTVWAISVSIQRLPQGWVTRTGESYLKNARRLLFSFLFVIMENEILPWCNFHILALSSPTLDFMKIIFTTVIQMIKDVLLMLNIMENFYQSW